MLQFGGSRVLRCLGRGPGSQVPVGQGCKSVARCWTRPAEPRIMRDERFRLAAALFAALAVATALPSVAAAPFDLLVLRQ